MSKHEVIKLSKAIEEYLKVLKIDKKVKEANLIRSWETVMGKTIANGTDKIYMKNGVLHVHLNSSVLRSELTMMKTRVLELLNEGHEEPLLKDVVFR
jgi:predicted nucleic acid-binding Zn ribbon protein